MHALLPQSPPETPRAAASLILLRDSPEGLQTLLVCRHTQMVNMSGVCVFPGGKLDNADSEDGIALDQPLHTLHQQLGEAAAVAANRRRLTNLGTFRAYALAYLQSLNTIHKGMTLMVRMLQPDEKGIPIELYAFTNTTAWVDYEGIQGDVFDHLIAILPEMGLRLYQSPSGADVAQLRVR